MLTIYDPFQAKFILETKDTTKEPENDSTGTARYIVATTIKTGTVELVNIKNEDVKCKVEYNMLGNMVGSVESNAEVKEEKMELNNHHYNDLNKNIKYTWELEVKAKQKTSLGFNFTWKQREAIPSKPRQTAFGGFGSN